MAQQVVPLWPHATPEPAQTTEAEVDVTKPTDALINGHRTSRITNVTRPTITVYPPAAGVRNTGAAALVFPGGGYTRLAWNGEGIDTCEWLNSIGMTCLLVKYRVPEKGHYPENYADLEDAQQAMRIARARAIAWHIDPKRIGVVGFSAGGNLAVLMSTHPDDRHVESTPASPDVDAKVDARADFAIVVYPAYLIVPSDPKNPVSAPAMPLTLDPVYAPNTWTPPTFVIAAGNDKVYGKNAPVYYQALLAAGVPADLHMYATGGHGFGIHPPGMPEEHWTDLATLWMEGLHLIPTAAVRKRLNAALASDATGAITPTAAVTPCPALTRPAPQPQSGQTTATTSFEADCF